jgi:hypothetical protein
MRTSKYRSKLEAHIASHLNRGGVQFGYESMSFSYVKECRYTPDFILPCGVILEAKGWFRPEDRSKLLAVKANNPGIDLRLVFQNARNRLNKKSKTTYGEWASKNGFPFSDGGVVPADWIKEGTQVEIQGLRRICSEVRKSVRSKTEKSGDAVS